MIRRFAVTIALALGGETPVLAGPPVYVGKNVPANQQISIQRVNHSGWDQLLKKYVDTQGNVAYGPWQQNTGDVQALDRYLALLSSASTKQPASREAKLAFWINAYNAVTVKGILREFPTTSIRNHTAKLAGYNIWKDLQLIVGGRPISLDSMEHQILRKMREPKIHFAIVCASRSCPKLRNEAYDPSRLEAQLAANTREFFAVPGNFQFDGRRFQVSSIIDWFGADFGRTQSDQLRYLAAYFPTTASQQAAASGQASVSYLNYDWGLNGRATLPPAAGSATRGSAVRNRVPAGSGSGRR